MTDDELVTIRIDSAPEMVRRRFRAACDIEGKTYPEMIEDLVTFYENNRTKFRQSNLNRSRDRNSG